ncbi:RNase H domain-containing protein [Trichonephila clavipes]|nr:RNase H domain-containing protein [Trichonephila clavipes]
MVKTNPTLAFIETDFKLGIHQTTALDYIKNIGFVSKLFVWVPHELSEKCLMDRISMCSSNLARHKREPFLDHLVTGDEKGILYKHVVRKKNICLLRGDATIRIQRWRVSEDHVVLLAWSQCLQWIPSHVGASGNETADELDGRGCDLSDPSCSVLSHSEIPSFHRVKTNLTWRKPPAHHCRSSIQLLSNWPSIGDSTSRSIQHLFQQLSDRHSIHLQWVLSHVGLPGNEVEDDLAKVATSDPVNPEDHMVLTSTEIYSRYKQLICKTWVVPPSHGTFKDTLDPPYHSRVPDHNRRHSRNFRLVT